MKLMKFLAELEKNKLGWWLIALCLLFFFLRFPSLIEPHWYGDEGIYEVIGQSMDHGRLLYRDIWDNKPPLLYVVYALAQGNQPTVKAFSLIVGLASVIILFFLSQKLFQKKRLSLILSLVFTVLLATPILEGNIANAEDFILLPIILAGLLLYQFANNKTSKRYILNPMPLVAGFLLGIAFLFKVVAILILQPLSFSFCLLIIFQVKNKLFYLSLVFCYLFSLHSFTFLSQEE